MTTDAGTGAGVGEDDGTGTVLVIDDDEVMLLTCRRSLERSGYRVETCPDGHAGLERLRALRPQVLLVDLKMPHLNGREVIERARAIDRDVVISVITGYATSPTAGEALQAGACELLSKPFTPDELRLLVRRCHDRWRRAVAGRRRGDPSDDTH